MEVYIIVDFKDLENFRGVPGIYRFYFKSNNKNYIGESIDLYKRLVKGYSDELILRNRPIIKAIKKYNWKNIQIELLDWGEYLKDKYTRLSLETAYIIYYNSLIKDGKGYNVCLVGNNTQGRKLSLKEIKNIKLVHTGKIVSQETRDKMSKSMSGIKKSLEHRQKLSKSKMEKNNPLWGKKHTKKTKLIISQKAKLRNYSYMNIPINQLNKITNKLIKIWASAKEASINIKGKSTLITKVCKKKANSAYGFKWEYAN